MPWVLTKELKKVLPFSIMNSQQIADYVGVGQKTIDRIRTGETEYTDFYKADNILSALGRVHELYTLEEFEHRRSRHGITGYITDGCRCPVCKEANRQKGQRARKRRKELAAS